jgi:hypothetical protein
MALIGGCHLPVQSRTNGSAQVLVCAAHIGPIFHHSDTAAAIFSPDFVVITCKIAYYLC